MELRKRKLILKAREKLFVWEVVTFSVDSDAVHYLPLIPVVYHYSTIHSRYKKGWFLTFISHMFLQIWALVWVIFLKNRDAWTAIWEINLPFLVFYFTDSVILYLFRSFIFFNYSLIMRISIILKSIFLKESLKIILLKI